MEGILSAVVYRDGWVNFISGSTGMDGVNENDVLMRMKEQQKQIILHLKYLASRELEDVMTESVASGGRDDW